MIDKQSQEYQDFLKAYRKQNENLIVKYGYCTQGTIGSEDSFEYTVGRNDKCKPDLVVRHPDWSSSYTVKQVVDMSESDELELEKVYESTTLTCKNTGTQTRFKVIEADKSYWRDKALGVFSRYQDSTDIQLLEIVMADENNVFENEQSV